MLTFSITFTKHYVGRQWNERQFNKTQNFLTFVTKTYHQSKILNLENNLWIFLLNLRVTKKNYESKLNSLINLMSMDSRKSASCIKYQSVLKYEKKVRNLLREKVFFFSFVSRNFIGFYSLLFSRQINARTFSVLLNYKVCFFLLYNVIKKKVP